MAEEMRPASPEQAPDPSDNYERSHPEHEAGMGRLDNNKATPAPQPSGDQESAKNRQEPRQINAHEVTDGRATGDDKEHLDQARPGDAASRHGRTAPERPNHSMHDEEPDGWDQAPTDIHDPRQKRHPRTEGRGGTP